MANIMLILVQTILGLMILISCFVFLIVFSHFWEEKFDREQRVSKFLSKFIIIEPTPRSMTGFIVMIVLWAYIIGKSLYHLIPAFRV